jgi:hypothetical protein
VKVGNFTKTAVGTVMEMNSGDVACYISLKDDQGKAFEEMADFSLCEQPNTFQGRRVRLSYALDKVMADACQGNPSCTKTQTVALVRTLTVLPSVSQTSKGSPAVAPHPNAQTSFCTPQEVVVFTCRTDAKMVSVCASQGASAKRGYLQYRFGKPDAADPLELIWPQGQVAPALAASGESVPFAGGGGSWLRFQKGSYGYVVYSGIGKWGPKGETREKQGIVVERGGKRIAHLKCTAAIESQLGPDWFDRLGIQVKDNEEFLFP